MCQLLRITDKAGQLIDNPIDIFTEIALKEKQDGLELGPNAMIAGRKGLF